MSVACGDEGVLREGEGVQMIRSFALHSTKSVKSSGGIGGAMAESSLPIRCSRQAKGESHEDSHAPRQAVIGQSLAISLSVPARPTSTPLRSQQPYPTLRCAIHILCENSCELYGYFLFDPASALCQVTPSTSVSTHL